MSLYNSFGTVHWQAADLIAWHTTLHLGRGVSKKTSPLKNPIGSGAHSRWFGSDFRMRLVSAPVRA